jgi:hypothetical protein
MQQWKPKPAPGVWIAVVLLLMVLAGVVFLGSRVVEVLLQPPEQWPINLTLFGEMLATLLLLLLAGFLSYRVLAAFTLSYEIDRNGVYIQWIGNRAVIPIDDIELVDMGDSKARMPWRIFQGIGYYWGQGQTSEGQRLHLFSTLPPGKSLFLHTTSSSYALSPDDQDGFVQHLEQRRRLGTTKPLAATYQRGRMLFYAFWNDQVVRWALVLALGLNVLLLGILFSRYPFLAEQVQMRFNAAGEVTELRPRHQILFLPLASFGLILLNMGLGLIIYRHEKTGARVLQIASVLMPFLFGVAVFSIIAR